MSEFKIDEHRFFQNGNCIVVQRSYGVETKIDRRGDMTRISYDPVSIFDDPVVRKAIGRYVDCSSDTKQLSDMHDRQRDRVVPGLAAYIADQCLGFNPEVDIGCNVDALFSFVASDEFSLVAASNAM